MDLCLGCCCLSLLGAYAVYYVIDRLLRYPYIVGRLQRYIFVTGCDTGFGYEIAKRLDRQGVHVFAGCLTEKGENLLQKQCSSRLKTVPLNVTDHGSVLKAFEIVKTALPKGKGLWGLVNNAGIGGNAGPIDWMIRSDYDQVLNVNLHGLIDVTVAFLPLLKMARGRVVNTASVFGRTALLGSAPYCISKYGVEAFSDTLRKQLRDYGVKVHIIEPGFHKTNIVAADTLSRAIKTTWDRLGPELKEEYGQEYYDKSRHQIIHEFIDKIASDRISDVVDAYEHALLAVLPRARYVVGWDAHLVWLPLQALPEWLGDWIQMALAKNRPIPAAVSKK